MVENQGILGLPGEPRSVEGSQGGELQTSRLGGLIRTDAMADGGHPHLEAIW